MKLEKLLHSQGFGTKKEVLRYIRAEEFQFNGITFSHPQDDIQIQDGQVFHLGLNEFFYYEKILIALHKPLGYECSQNPQHHQSVFSLLPDYILNRGIQPVGRLDVDTTGLILFTDSGTLIHKLTSPKKEVSKIYQVTLKHPVNTDWIEEFKNGVELKNNDGHVKPQNAYLESETQLILEISQGKYHQVKRMVAAMHNRVEALHRLQVGEYSLKQLKEKNWEILDFPQIH